MRPDYDTANVGIAATILTLMAVLFHEGAPAWSIAAGFSALAAIVAWTSLRDIAHLAVS